MEQILIAAFYQFVPLGDVRALQSQLRQWCRERAIKGTVLLATEGINGTIAGERALMSEFLALLQQDERFASMPVKRSVADQMPFYRLKVLHKKEILSFDFNLLPDVTVGEHVKPTAWNALISDPEVLLLDTRNDYEVEVGTFAGAVDPHIETFQEFKAFVDKQLDPAKNPKVAMFCTGGIRCEKASAYMLQQGFENVYQLEGGILNYFEKVHKDESQWQGECFIFDQRVSLDHDLEPGTFQKCYACQHPLSPADLQSPHFEQGVSCPSCHSAQGEEKRTRLRERQKQVTLAQQRGEDHIGRIDTRLGQPHKKENQEPH